MRDDILADNLKTYFFLDGRKINTLPELLLIPLYKGMTITMHGHPREYEVIDWNFHLGHADEDAGLRINLA